MEKNIVVKDIAEVITQESVPRKLDCHMRTVGKSYTKEDTEWQKRWRQGICVIFQYNLRWKPVKTSKQIFENSGRHSVPKTAKLALKILWKFRNPIKTPLLSKVSNWPPRCIAGSWSPCRCHGLKTCLCHARCRNHIHARQRTITFSNVCYTTFLAFPSIEDNSLMDWPVCSPD